MAFSLSPRSLMPEEWKRKRPLYRSLRRGRDGERVFHLYRFEHLDAFCFAAGTDFYLQSKAITGRLIGPALGFELEIRLLGPVLPYWLEKEGFPTLHASAVAVDGQAVGFLSRQGGGKTGLAAAMMQAGHPLLTDDVLPVEERNGTFFARPGYPRMRMWPDEAAWFVERWQELPLVHPDISKRWVPVGGDGFGAFLDASLPLACLYLPERRPGGPVEIRDLSPRDALIELVRYSFAPRLVEAAGLQPFRFDFFSRLVRSVPVRRLSYPAGFERLPEVVRSVGLNLRRDSP